MSEPLLILDGIHASYVKKEILRGVSLTVERGEVVALLGGNGSGKSTTLKVIAGLLPPTKGRVIFNGHDITHIPPHRRQKLGISYLLQGGRVFSHLTVEENLRLSASHARDGTQNGSKSTELGLLFSELVEHRHTRAGLLSGGQRQMLAIEMVMVQRPLLALLDEPSGALAEQLAISLLERLVPPQLTSPLAILLVEQNALVASDATSRRLTLNNGLLHTPAPTTEMNN
jgi:branched-chain amino acid transport system ATP-binding protein